MKTRYQLAILALAATTGWAVSWAIAQEDVAQEDLPIQKTRPSASSAKKAPPTDARHYSYAIGLDIGASFRADDIPLDMDSLFAGVRDGQKDAKPLYDQQTCMFAMQQLNQMRIHRMVETNMRFLEENIKAEGVKVTASGLQFKVLNRGNGATPTATDVVRTHYRGTFIDGTEFDSSYSSNEPATFTVGGVIPGWTEALQKMKVGDKWQLFIPSDLAYGAQGYGAIPPHATLIFELELLGIEGK